MAMRISALESMGDGTIVVSARTPEGNHVSVRMGHDKLGMAIMWAILARQGALIDAQARALDARKGQVES